MEESKTLIRLIDQRARNVEPNWHYSERSPSRCGDVCSLLPRSTTLTTSLRRRCQGFYRKRPGIFSFFRSSAGTFCPHRFFEIGYGVSWPYRRPINVHHYRFFFGVFCLLWTINQVPAGRKSSHLLLVSISAVPTPVGGRRGGGGRILASYRPYSVKRPHRKLTFLCGP